MSKKQQYTTKFYESNGGIIDAVTRDESGKVVNVFSGFQEVPSQVWKSWQRLAKTGQVQTRSSLVSGAERL